MAGAATPFVSAPSFELGIDALGGTLDFQELGGITSKIDSTEYIYSDPKEGVVHTRQFGKTTPPTIKLKRGLDAKGNNAIFLWHDLCRSGAEGARVDGLLTVKDASGQMKIVYKLTDAWCNSINVSGIKAGDSQVVMIEIEITCTSIAAVA